MQIIEETTALGVPFCHFVTATIRNQYNLTYTKTQDPDTYEVHLIPLNIMDVNGKIIFNKDMRKFLCDKVHDFMQKNKCTIYFNINCIGINNEFLVWKILRWLRCYDREVNADVIITEDAVNSLRFFEFKITL